MGGPLGSISQKQILPPQKTEAGKKETRVSDDNTQQSLEELLKLTKETNLHLRIMTGNFEINEDIE